MNRWPQDCTSHNVVLLAQVRFEMCAQALDASIQCIAPWRDAEFLERFKGRADLLAYATKNGIPVSSTPKVSERVFSVAI